jgi:hypothetical protein
MLPVALICPFLRESQRGNHKWTNQSNWHHREKTKGAIKNEKTRAIGIIERKPKEQSKIDKPEQLATCFLSILPIALVCSFLIAPLVFSLCCQLLWFVHF